MGVTLRTKVYARRGEEDRVFSSVKEAAVFVNGIEHMIYKCCEGKRGYHHGWMFSYKPFEPIDTTEEWRDVVGYEGKYQVSNKGNVRTFQRDRCMSLKQKNTQGYMTVMLWNNKKHKDAKVHRLVAEAFIPNPDGLPVVNHKDENPSNNCVENLEWCTRSYNILHSYNHLIRKQKGVKVLCEETRVIYNTIKDATKSCSINYSTFRKKLYSENTKIGGYTWKILY